LQVTMDSLTGPASAPSVAVKAASSGDGESNVVAGHASAAAASMDAATAHAISYESQRMLSLWLHGPNPMTQMRYTD
jgi:hypothetical protein